MLKMGAEDALPDGAVGHLTELAHYVADIANLAPDARQPYSGRYAFTHKAGLHTSGVARLSTRLRARATRDRGQPSRGGGLGLRRRRDDPDEGRRARRSICPSARSPPWSIRSRNARSRGYAFDVAEASLELLMRRATGWTQPFFEIESYRVHVEERMVDDEPPLAEATVKVRTKGTRHIESAEGAGPVGALDDALRKALVNDYPRARPHRAGGLPRPGAGRDRPVPAPSCAC